MRGLVKWLILFVFYRYSDVLVHRLLAVAIGAMKSYPELLDKRKVQVYRLQIKMVYEIDVFPLRWGKTIIFCSEFISF